MLQRLLRALRDLHRTDAEDRRVEAAAEGLATVGRNVLDSDRHTEDRADGCAVAVGVEAGLNCKTDGLAEVAAARNMCRYLKAGG